MEEYSPHHVTEGSNLHRHPWLRPRLIHLGLPLLLIIAVQQVGGSGGTPVSETITLLANRNYWISPPLCITPEQVDDMMDRFDATLTEWEAAMGVS